MITSRAIPSQDPKVAILELTATEDADTGGAVAHPFDGQAVNVQFEPVKGRAGGAYDRSAWRLGESDDAKALEVVKDGAPGSGAAVPQAVMFVRLAEVAPVPAEVKPARSKKKKASKGDTAGNERVNASATDTSTTRRVAVKR